MGVPSPLPNDDGAAAAPAAPRSSRYPVRVEDGDILVPLHEPGASVSDDDRSRDEADYAAYLELYRNAIEPRAARPSRTRPHRAAPTGRRPAEQTQ